VSDSVFVTGIGIISAIGNHAGEVMHSLQHQVSGIGNITHINTLYQQELPVGEVKATNKELLELANPGIPGPYSRTTLLGLIAARQALKHAGIVRPLTYRAGLISATTVGGMDRSEIFFKHFLQDKRKGRLRNIVTHDCGDCTERIARILGITGYFTTINTACSSSANAIMYGARLIRQGYLDCVVAGGIDALTLFTLNGFNSLMILDKNPCRPFDEHRNGLNLGEGAGFLVLESGKTILGTRKTALAEIKGYGNACDAYHQTASSPEGTGAWLSMKKALDVAGMGPEDIDYINAHGTGTKNNDLSEGIAIQKLFENKVPPCSSTKSYTGHTLGAAGAIEAVLCVIALQQQWIYPNLNFKIPMTELRFAPESVFHKDVKLKNIMSNSFGFGGNNTSLVFSTC
jgi:3-oxoacyl-[acyl-carrier-protein] synthase-1